MMCQTRLIAILLGLLFLLPDEAGAESSTEQLLLQALEADLAFDLPPSALEKSLWGRVIEAEMWHTHARQNPGAKSGRCHATDPLRKEAHIAIAGPAALASVDCGDALNVGLPVFKEVPSEGRVLRKGHLQLHLQRFGVQCFTLGRANIRPGATELLLRAPGSVWWEDRPEEVYEIQQWSSIPWPISRSSARICLLPTSLETEFFMAMRRVRESKAVPLNSSATLLRALLQANRDEAQKILEEVNDEETDESFSWIRRAVDQKWPALIHIQAGPQLPVLANSDVSRRIASHLQIRTRIDQGEFRQALQMIRARINQLGNAGHYLKARSLEGLGWEFEAREATMDALVGLHGDCRIRALAESLKVELPPLLGNCPAATQPSNVLHKPVIRDLANAESNPEFKNFLAAPFPSANQAWFKKHPTLIVGHHYWVKFEANGDSQVYRRSLYKVQSPRGAISVQHWSADSDWVLKQLVRRRKGTEPEYGHSVEGNAALILEDVQPGDEVEVLQVRERPADPYVGAGANYERLSCSDRMYPVAHCSVQVQQDASAPYPLHVRSSKISCRRSENGHQCTGGPYKPAPNEAEPGSPWALLAHVEISHDIPEKLRLQKAQTLIRSALLSARGLAHYGPVKSPEELHERIREGKARSASATESALGLNPNDIDLLKGLNELGEEAFIAHTPGLFSHDGILGQGTRRVVVPRGPDQGSIWWTTAFALPFANILPALDQGRRSINMGPKTGVQRLKVPVVESTGGAISISGDLLFDEERRSFEGTVKLKWTGVFALSAARNQQGIENTTRQWVSLLLPRLTPGKIMKLVIGEDDSSLEVHLEVSGRELSPEDLAIQIAHPQALSNLLHRDERTSKLMLGYGMELHANLRVDRVQGLELDPRSDIEIQGKHAVMNCVRRYIARRTIDLRCGLKVPATYLSPSYWPNLRQSLSKISDQQRVPLTD